MAGGVIHLSVVTPERTVLECEAAAVSFTAHDGDIGFLPGRAPILLKVGIGTLRVEREGRTERYFIDGGFAQMVDNRLTVLTAQAHSASEIKRADAEQALEAAHELRVTDEASFDARQAAIRRAKTRLALVS